jgi:hypothetical protein
MTTILRVYTRPEEIGKDGYPLAWHKCPTCLGDGCSECGGEGSAKDLVRALAGHRCVRCGHPYRKGAHGKGEWSPCDEQCTHAGSFRHRRVAHESRALRPSRPRWRRSGASSPSITSRWTRPTCAGGTSRASASAAISRSRARSRWTASGPGRTLGMVQALRRGLVRLELPRRGTDPRGDASPP